jgi:hypothetical protein
MAEPLEVGAVQEMVAWAVPPVAVTLIGALGTVAGVMAFDGELADPVPTALVAFTVKV